MSNIALDNRIFLLQHTTGLTPELKRQLMLADIAYLNDKDSDAQAIVSGIEKSCVEQGIQIFSCYF